MVWCCEEVLYLMGVWLLSDCFVFVMFVLLGGCFVVLCMLVDVVDVLFVWFDV